MSLSTLRRESILKLQCHSKDYKLKFEARYGIDGEKRMKVDGEPESEIPDKVKVELWELSGADFSKSVQYECSSIEHGVTGKAGFLHEFVKSPENFMKISRSISLHTLGTDIKCPHSFPGEEVLLVRKDDADGETITYKKKSDLAECKITRHECQQIYNFVDPQNFQLTSVLWLLSEFALIKFCKGIYIVTRRE